MAASFLEPGNVYEFIYRNYHVDPEPMLYVIWSDREYTVGFNLHYIFLVSLGLDPKKYKGGIARKLWANMSDKILRDDYNFKNFVALLNGFSNSNLSSEKDFIQYRKIIAKQYPFTMKMYRKYLNIFITDVELKGRGIDWV